MNTRGRFPNLRAPAESESPEKALPADQGVEGLQGDVLHTRLQLETLGYAYESHVRRTRVLWVLAVFSLAAVVAVTAMGYRYVMAPPAAFSSSELETAFSRLHDRLTTVEGRIDAVADGAVGARAGGDAAIADATLQQTSELKDQVASLQQELMALRTQALQTKAPAQRAAQTPPSNPARRPTPADSANVASRNSPLAAIDPIDTRGMQRFAFELRRNRTEQIAPDIYLTIKEGSGNLQQIDGWMQLTREGRIVWLRELGTGTPLSFVTKDEPRTHQLVLTRVGAALVAGYVLVPMPVSSASVVSR